MKIQTSFCLQNVLEKDTAVTAQGRIPPPKMQGASESQTVNEIYFWEIGAAGLDARTPCKRIPPFGSLCLRVEANASKQG